MKSAFSAGKFKYTGQAMDTAHTRLFKMGLGG
jgi:truncated hemoglobin YjbI